MSTSIIALTNLHVADFREPVSEVSTLNLLPFGTNARVTSIDGRNPSARRLMEMGVVPGVAVRVIKSAPLGDPLQVQVRGYQLALRRAEAQAISVIVNDR